MLMGRTSASLGFRSVIKRQTANIKTSCGSAVRLGGLCLARVAVLSTIIEAIAVGLGTLM